MPTVDFHANWEMSGDLLRFQLSHNSLPIGKAPEGLGCCFHPEDLREGGEFAAPSLSLVFLVFLKMQVMERP
jgi:hypothetical protein